jgi:hypothetical protein
MYLGVQQVIPTMQWPIIALPTQQNSNNNNAMDHHQRNKTSPSPPLT